jgi:hypothetical protein
LDRQARSKHERVTALELAEALVIGNRGRSDSER